MIIKYYQQKTALYRLSFKYYLKHIIEFFRYVRVQSCEVCTIVCICCTAIEL